MTAYKADQIKKMAENEITKSKIHLKTMDCLKKIITWLSKETGQCEVLGKSTSLLGFQPPTPFKPLQDL